MKITRLKLKEIIKEELVKLLDEASLKYIDGKHKKVFNVIYDAKKKEIEKIGGEISKPFMSKSGNIKTSSFRNLPAFQTMYIDKNGKKQYKMWAINSDGYDESI